MENRIINHNKILVQELCDEHNKIRKNPKCYIEILKSVLGLIRRSNILRMKKERPFKTIEGKDSILDAIDYLSKISESKIKLLSNSPLKVSEFLCQASYDHAKDIGIHGTCTHIGTDDNSHMNTRVEKYCDWNGGLAESLDFGTVNAQNIMIKLLICDGDKKRIQRQYIFDPGFVFFGAGFYNHIKYKRCSVISYAGVIQPKNSNFSEKELIQNYLRIHMNFRNKNKKEVDKFLKKDTYNSNLTEREEDENQKTVQELSQREDEKEEINKNEEPKENKSNKSQINNIAKLEQINEVKEEKSEKKENDFESSHLSNEKLTIIVENETEKENESNKIIEISNKKVIRYGIEINERMYQIKEGNYHIVEEEIKNDDNTKIIDDSL